MSKKLKLNRVDPSRTHRWSGWPGAYCVYCGSEDPIENALALEWMSPPGVFDTAEHRNAVQEALVCQAPESTRTRVDRAIGRVLNARETKGNVSFDTEKVD